MALPVIPPRTFTSSLHPSNRGAVDWGWQSLAAYGCQNLVSIVDVANLQIVQTLDAHRVSVTCVKWARENFNHDLATPYTLRIASGDEHGKVYVWLVGEAKPFFEAAHGSGAGLTLPSSASSSSLSNASASSGAPSISSSNASATSLNNSANHSNSAGAVYGPGGAGSASFGLNLSSAFNASGPGTGLGKAVLRLDWHISDPKLLFVLHAPSHLSLWNTISGVKLWVRDFVEPLFHFALNPFDASCATVLGQRSIYFLDDVSVSAPPSHQSRRYQFTAPSSASSSAAAASSASSAGASNSSSSSLLSASRFGSGLLSYVVAAATNEPASTSSGSSSGGSGGRKSAPQTADDALPMGVDCVQLVYSLSEKNRIFLTFKKEILIVDVDTFQTVGVISLEKSSAPFAFLMPCLSTPDVLFCFHENGTFSSRLRRGSSKEVSFDTRTQSELLRSSKGAKPFGVAQHPLDENRFLTVYGDGRLYYWEYQVALGPPSVSATDLPADPHLDTGPSVPAPEALSTLDETDEHVADQDQDQDQDQQKGQDDEQLLSLPKRPRKVSIATKDEDLLSVSRKKSTQEFGAQLAPISLTAHARRFSEHLLGTLPTPSDRLTASSTGSTTTTSSASSTAASNATPSLPAALSLLRPEIARFLLVGEIENLSCNPSCMAVYTVKEESLSWIALGDHEGHVYVFDLLTGRLRRNLKIHASAVRSVDWVDAGTLVSYSSEAAGNGNWKNSVLKTDLSSGKSKLVRTRPGGSTVSSDDSPIAAMKVSPLRQYVALIFKDQPLELWELQSLCLLRDMPSFSNVTAFEWSPSSAQRATKAAASMQRTAKPNEEPLLRDDKDAKRAGASAPLSRSDSARASDDGSGEGLEWTVVSPPPSLFSTGSNEPSPHPPLQQPAAAAATSGVVPFSINATFAFGAPASSASASASVSASASTSGSTAAAAAAAASLSSIALSGLSAGAKSEASPSSVHGSIARKQSGFKETFVFTHADGSLFHFSVSSAVVSQGSRLPADVGMSTISAIGWKENNLVTGDVSGNLHMWDLKAGTARTVQTQTGAIRKLKFAPEKGNAMLLVLYANECVDVWLGAERISVFKPPARSAPSLSALAQSFGGSVAGAASSFLSSTMGMDGGHAGSGLNLGSSGGGGGGGGGNSGTVGGSGGGPSFGGSFNGVLRVVDVDWAASDRIAFSFSDGSLRVCDRGFRRAVSPMFAYQPAPCLGLPYTMPIKVALYLKSLLQHQAWTKSNYALPPSALVESFHDDLDEESESPGAERGEKEAQSPHDSESATDSDSADGMDAGESLRQAKMRTYSSGLFDETSSPEILAELNSPGSSSGKRPPENVAVYSKMPGAKRSQGVSSQARTPERQSLAVDNSVTERVLFHLGFLPESLKEALASAAGTVERCMLVARYYGDESDFNFWAVASHYLEKERQRLKSALSSRPRASSMSMPFIDTNPSSPVRATPPGTFPMHKAGATTASTSPSSMTAAAGQNANHSFAFPGTASSLSAATSASSASLAVSISAPAAMPVPSATQTPPVALDPSWEESQRNNPTLEQQLLSAAEAQASVPPLPSRFDVLSDVHDFRARQLDRAALHRNHRNSYDLTKTSAAEHLLLGQHDRAVQLLLETAPDNNNFKFDALKACLISAVLSPESFRGTIKLVATSLIARGDIDEGVQLLCLIGNAIDACRYLQTNRLWERAAWLAKATLPDQELQEVMQRWVDELLASEQRLKAALVLVSMRHFRKAINLLVAVNHTCLAALLLEVCLEYGIITVEKEQDKELVVITLEAYARYLGSISYDKAARYYSAKSRTLAVGK